MPEEVEDAVVQVMTYLIENETAALLVPGRFIAQTAPPFPRGDAGAGDPDRRRSPPHRGLHAPRAAASRRAGALPTAGGQASLKTLLDEPDFAIASFLLSVLGEGSFLSLLWFLQHYAPDPVTAAVARLAAQDEARHVRSAWRTCGPHVGGTPRCASGWPPRSSAGTTSLRHTAGLNAEVFDALILIAAGSWNQADLRQGHRRVMELTRDMDEGRRLRLARLGFNEQEAAELSSLHTRNFM